MRRGDRGSRYAAPRPGTKGTAGTSSDGMAAERLPLLAKLLPYYLDCVQADERQGARHLLSDEGKTYLVPPLTREWCLEERGVLTVDLGGRTSALAKSLRQRRGSGALFYGYPLYVDWVERSRSGWTGGFAVPVFLLPVEYEQSGSTLELRLELEWPRVNGEFLKCAFASVEERRAFMHDMGLLEAEGNPPDEGLAFFGRRLRELGVVPEVEPVLPEALGAVPDVPAISKAGLYNRPLVILGERSKFTAGLEHELGEIQKESPSSGAGRTVLRRIFGDDTAEQSPSAERAVPSAASVEVVALNDEQRAAVRSAFENPLTVVTGPPGTGKSQVVVTLLANAYLRGEKVLFTSRNPKAVDVVVERLNGLSSHPLVVRSGTRSGDRDLRGELSRFLMQVLSASTTDEDRRAHTQALATLDSLRARRAALWDKVERSRRVRNRVDQLDRELDGFRERLGQSLFDGLTAADQRLPEGDPALALSIVRSHLGPPTGLLGRLRRVINRGSDAARVEEQVRAFRGRPELFGDIPTQPPRTLGWDAWVAPLERLAERADAVRTRQDYQAALSTLCDLPSPESFCEELADVEERIWDWGARLIAAYGRLLPDRLTEPVRRSLAQFRATLERLAQDQIGGKAYAQLRREQERLFTDVSRVLPVWCVTNLSARGALPFEPGLFDLVVIDEASQCDIPSAIPLLYRAKRAVIIGDPHQLRHVSTLEKHVAQLLELRHGMTTAADQPYTYVGNSLFDLATHCVGRGEVVQLREHFRSHADIVSFSNRTWYQNTLRICTDYRRLRRPPDGKLGIRWSQVAGRVQRPASGGALCVEEAEAVVGELVDLLVRREFAGSIGVVTPFRAQANRIRDLVNERLSLSLLDACDLIVDTAHGFQGDERDLILFSPCVGPNMPQGAKYFLTSTGNLFNVAITRARALLHVIGDLPACANCGVPHIEGFAAEVSGRDRQERREAGHAPPPWDDPRVGHWEHTFYDALVRSGLKPMPQYPVHQYRLDLAIIGNGHQLDVETDGEHFHRDMDGSRCRDDVLRDWRLAMLGWEVKRFWVYQIRDNMDQCVREVVDILSRPAHPSA